MKSYLTLGYDLYHNSTLVKNPRGHSTFSDTAYVWKHDMSKGFPLLTTKKMAFKHIVHELLWMLSGDPHIQYLKDNNVKIWDSWADNTAYVGPLYGWQWRNWGGDQITKLIENIKSNPTCRRHLVNAWNVSMLEDMNLVPCHFAFKVDIISDQIHGTFFLRSSDYMLGLPWNMAFYALLFMMIGQQTGFPVKRVNALIANLHLYEDHVDGFQEQQHREPMDLPQVGIDKKKSMFDYSIKDFNLKGYACYDKISLECII